MEALGSSVNTTGLKYSNCLIESIILQLDNPHGDIGMDKNSPSGRTTFYFDLNGLRYRFRRKIRRYGNKSRILFYGYRVIEEIPK